MSKPFSLDNLQVQGAKTKSGIPYYVRVDPGSYSERFATDGNQIVAQLIVRWSDAAEFRKEVLGYTRYTPGTEGAPGAAYFSRTLPLLCPFSDEMYAVDMQSVEVGTLVGDPKNYYGKVEYGEDVLGEYTEEYTEGELVETGYTIVREQDATLEGSALFTLNEENWPEYNHIVYNVSFTHKPFVDLIEDDDLPVRSGIVEKRQPSEMLRYIHKEAPVNVRELRRPDYGFETDEVPAIRIPVVGFIPYIEKDIQYTWHQIPYEHLPRETMESTDLLLHINDDEFDGYAENTLLYIGTKNIEKPYRGADGALYYDPVIHFRWNPYGHNKFKKTNVAPPGDLVYLKAVGVVPTKRLYEETDQFYKLFQPKRF